eukprot:gene3365-2488_t
MSVFGEILFLSNVSGTIVFVAVMIFLTIFEALLHSVEVECSKRGYKGLIKKLYREFMIMGFISFAILLGTESSSGFSTTNQWYQSFHLAHIVILFIGITFLCQAILLVSLISLRNKTLLSYGDSNPEKLALEYINIHHEGGIQRWFFDHGLITIPFPQLRERIEYKMLQEFFIHFYNLPREFKFANYMSQSLKDYIISLVEVRPITWIVLVALIAVNYFRIMAIDPYYQHDVCERYPAKNLNYGVGHRLLAGGGGSSEAQYDDQHAYEVCNEYTLRYVFFCSMMIVFYLLGVFIASEVYIQRLIDKVLDVEESIEREEERLAAEDTPMFDIDDLHDRDSSVIDSVGGNDQHHQHQHPNSSSSRPSSFRRTGSHQSLDSLPPHPSTWDVENSGRSAGSAGGGGGQARGRSSVASQHRASLASQFFGGYFEDDHASVAGGVAGVAQALHGIVMGKNRRHLYLHCIQRMIQTEEEVTRKEARRMSIGSDDGGAHGHPSSHTSPTPSGLASTAAPGGNRLSVHSAGSHHARARGISHAPAYISEIYDQHFRPNHPHPLHHSGGPQHHGADGHSAHDDRSPTPYFQIEHTPAATSDGADGDGGGGRRAFDDGWWCCGLWPLLRGLFRLTRIVLLWCGRCVIDTLLGHHIGTPHADVQPDRDIQARVRVFRSIFLWQRPGLYYFAVEFSLLIQCFYIALWATNFVVIARDSYFPVLWEIALVVPLPINFFLLKQIIYTSCMVKAIVQMDQRTANRIIEQAIDERNVTQRLRRIVRDTMKTWEVPRKEWPGRLQAYFDLYADADHTMDKDSFKAFLHEIQIFITDDSLKNLFKVIDVDRDHRIAWSMLTKIIFPDAKKTKKIKLRKRHTDGGGRVAYEYVVSEEAKKELEQEKAHAERRGSMLGMLSRVSASTAEGAISAVRSNSLTRLSMLAMLGPQQAQQQPGAAADGGGVASRTHSESKLERLFPKLLPLSTPERAQQAKTMATDALMEGETAAADESTAAVSIVVPAASKPRGVTISDVTVDINAATSGYTYGYGASSSSSSTGAATTTISVPRSTGGLPPLAMPAARPTTPTTAPSTAATVNVRPAPPTTTATATGDVISISSRMSNLRISARNLFDI